MHSIGCFDDLYELTEMDLRKLRHVVLLAEIRHFARAAEQAHITQSALSRSIQALEQQLGVRLFDRSQSGVEITDAGRELVARATVLLRGARDLAHEMAQFRRGEIGQLAVGAGPFPAATLVPNAFALLHDSHPGLRITLEINRTEALCDMLLRDEIAVFVADTRADDLPEQLAIEPVMIQHGGLFCRAQHPLAGKRGLTLQDLRNERLASVQLPGSIRKGLQRAFGTGQASPIAIACDNVYLLKDLARRTDVILACTEEALREELAAGEFVALDLQQFRPAMVRVGAVTLKNRSRSPAVALFIDTIKQVCASQAVPAARKDSPKRRAAGSA